MTTARKIDLMTAWQRLELDNGLTLTAWHFMLMCLTIKFSVFKATLHGLKDWKTFLSWSYWAHTMILTSSALMYLALVKSKKYGSYLSDELAWPWHITASEGHSCEKGFFYENEINQALSDLQFERLDETFSEKLPTSICILTFWNFCLVKWEIELILKFDFPFRAFHWKWIRINQNFNHPYV
jgi:hypothetical protein